jgi:hypothetical protein
MAAPEGNEWVAIGLNQTTQHSSTTLGVWLIVAQPSWLRAQAGGLRHQNFLSGTVPIPCGAIELWTRPQQVDRRRVIAESGAEGLCKACFVHSLRQGIISCCYGRCQSNIKSMLRHADTSRV